jgi:hypothetical protein
MLDVVDNIINMLVQACQTGSLLAACGPIACLMLLAVAY